MSPLTWVHIAGGSIALLAGYVALFARKGSPLHVQIGTWFFASMVVLTSTGALIAASIPERGTATIGVFTLYLVATSWVTVRNRSGEAGHFEWVAMAVAMGCAIAQTIFGVMASRSPNGLLDSLPAMAHYPFAVLALLAAALDLNFIIRGRLTGSQRIARHLWRMCVALTIAAMSFFIGQQDEFPQAWRGAFIWFSPPLVAFGAMVFWIARVRLAKTWRRASTPRSAAAADPLPDVAAAAT